MGELEALDAHDTAERQKFQATQRREAAAAESLLSLPLQSDVSSADAAEQDARRIREEALAAEARLRDAQTTERARRRERLEARLAMRRKAKQTELLGSGASATEVAKAMQEFE